MYTVFRSHVRFFFKILNCIWRIDRLKLPSLSFPMSRNKCCCLLCGILFIQNVSLSSDRRSLFGLDRTTDFIVEADELNAHSSQMKNKSNEQTEYWPLEQSMYAICVRQSLLFLSFFTLHQSIPREWKRHWYWFPNHICFFPNTTNTEQKEQKNKNWIIKLKRNKYVYKLAIHIIHAKVYSHNHIPYTQAQVLCSTQARVREYRFISK